MIRMDLMFQHLPAQFLGVPYPPFLSTPMCWRLLLFCASHFWFQAHITLKRFHQYFSRIFPSLLSSPLSTVSVHVSTSYFGSTPTFLGHQVLPVCWKTFSALLYTLCFGHAELLCLNTSHFSHWGGTHSFVLHRLCHSHVILIQKENCFWHLSAHLDLHNSRA